MGAWGIKPCENDTAMEWMADAIERPILEAIKGRLTAFTTNPSDDVLKHEVEAAVALLIDLTAEPPHLKYCQFEISFHAENERLWEQAIMAISKLRADSSWLSDWGSRERKEAILDELLLELSHRSGSIGNCTTES